MYVLVATGADPMIQASNGPWRWTNHCLAEVSQRLCQPQSDSCNSESRNPRYTVATESDVT